MSSPAKQASPPPSAGLCADCAYARLIESSRGSVFILCELSSADPHFPKYPRLPVLCCSGYNKSGGQQPGPGRS